ncbi:hypothetical protein FOL47_009614 [Perkinsus chesapeaki]|uniref:RNase NYN domain-containing protein n=1 Tax=Perkinsus chesapeaki TaxID=330153 RepID=A0A7J6L792_PERCH|nr:hypothetical protein FOL47_009614 [Perkinsus chesapeaki]
MSGSDDGISQPKLTGSPEVVLNAANIGFTYGRQVLHKEHTFDWRGVTTALQHYQERGIECVWVVASVAHLKHNPDVPKELERIMARITPRDGMPDRDDLMTVRIAEKYSAQYVDNDNYRNWEGRAPPSTIQWVKDNLELHVHYDFLPDGTFSTDMASPVPTSAMDIDDSFDMEQRGAAVGEPQPSPVFGTSNASFKWHPSNQSGDEKPKMKNFKGTKARPSRSSRVDARKGGYSVRGREPWKPCRPTPYGQLPQVSTCDFPTFSVGANGTPSPPSNGSQSVEEAWTDGATMIGSFNADEYTTAPAPQAPRNLKRKAKPEVAGLQRAPTATRRREENSHIRRSASSCCQTADSNSGNVEGWDDNLVAFITNDGFDSHRANVDGTA